LKRLGLDGRGRGFPAPYFSLARAAWLPCVATWDAATGEFRRVEGARGFETYREAVEASRFLAVSLSAVDR
jgi:hypothetical protein